jgi:hypothetical protein
MARLCILGVRSQKDPQQKPLGSRHDPPLVHFQTVSRSAPLDLLTVRFCRLRLAAEIASAPSPSPAKAHDFPFVPPAQLPVPRFICLLALREEGGPTGDIQTLGPAQVSYDKPVVPVVSQP